MSPELKQKERDDLAMRMADFERKNGAVETTPILIRDSAKSQFLSTGIRNTKSNDQAATIVWNGKSYLSNDLADAHGIRGDTFRARLKRGWSIEKGLGLI